MVRAFQKDAETINLYKEYTKGPDGNEIFTSEFIKKVFDIIGGNGALEKVDGMQIVHLLSRSLELPIKVEIDAIDLETRKRNYLDQITLILNGLDSRLKEDREALEIIAGILDGKLLGLDLSTQPKLSENLKSFFKNYDAPIPSEADLNLYEHFFSRPGYDENKMKPKVSIFFKQLIGQYRQGILGLYINSLNNSTITSWLDPQTMPSNLYIKEKGWVTKAELIGATYEIFQSYSAKLINVKVLDALKEAFKIHAPVALGKEAVKERF